MNWLKHIILLTGICFIFTQDPPTEFEFNQSNLQAFYFIQSVTLNGEAIDASDWVGAFNGDVCVGARKWDTTGFCSDVQYTNKITCEIAGAIWTWNQCGGGICDVPAMGETVSDQLTTDYMIDGDIPTFKIYVTSANDGVGEYYDAVASQTINTWINGGTFFITNLNVIVGCKDDTACNYNANAMANDGICTYPTQDEDGSYTGNSLSGTSAIWDCDGNCTAVVDDCGVCGGAGKNPYGCCGVEAPNANGECELLAIETPTIPNNYSISNIYPNPFNPITNIEYNLPENTAVKLTVYNIHGRKLQTLVKGFKFAGHHRINWNASNYPSGVYFIKLEGSMYSKTQKVILIK